MGIVAEFRIWMETDCMGVREVCGDGEECNKLVAVISNVNHNLLHTVFNTTECHKVKYQFNSKYTSETQLCEINTERSNAVTQTHRQCYV